MAFGNIDFVEESDFWMMSVNYGRGEMAFESIGYCGMKRMIRC